MRTGTVVRTTYDEHPKAELRRIRWETGNTEIPSRFSTSALFQHNFLSLDESVTIQLEGQQIIGSLPVLFKLWLALR